MAVVLYAGCRDWRGNERERESGRKIGKLRCGRRTESLGGGKKKGKEYNQIEYELVKRAKTLLY